MLLDEVVSSLRVLGTTRETRWVVVVCARLRFQPARPYPKALGGAYLPRLAVALTRPPGRCTGRVRHPAASSQVRPWAGDVEKKSQPHGLTRTLSKATF